MKPVDVTFSAYFGHSVESNDKDSKSEIGNRVRISKYKNNFLKYCTLNWPEEVFMIKKVKDTVSGHMLLVIWTVKKLLEHFTKKNRKKQTKKNLWKKN